MSRAVSIFFSRDVTGFSEPGTCPRCKRSVKCGSRGNPKAHKCPHGTWCSRDRKQCKACSEVPAAELTPTERATLDPLIVAALTALGEQVAAHADHDKVHAECKGRPFTDPCTCSPARIRRNSSIASANAAGKSLADAIAGLRGGK